MTASRPLERGARVAAWLADASAPRTSVRGFAARTAGLTAATAAAACGGVIVARRLAGAIDPAGPALLIVATAAGAALVFAADAARRAGAPLGGAIAARVGLVLAVAGLVAPPRTSGPGGWITITAAAVAVAVVVCRMPRVSAPVARPATPGRTGSGSPRRHRGGPSRDRGRIREHDAGHLRQRFERRELPAGGERVRGRVVVVVPSGGKAGYGHLGFCPAFATTPVVEVTTAYDGVEATVAAAEVLPWGVRVECRLAEPAEEHLEIPVDLVAVAAAEAP